METFKSGSERVVLNLDMAKVRLSTDQSSLLSSINSDISLNDSSAQGSLSDVFDFGSHPKELKEIDLESNLEAFLKDAAKASTSSLKDSGEKCYPDTVLKKGQEKSTQDLKEAEKGSRGQKISSETRLKPDKKKMKENKSKSKKIDISNSIDKDSLNFKAVSNPTKTVICNKVRQQNSNEVPLSASVKVVLGSKQREGRIADTENRLPKEKSEDKQHQKRKTSHSSQPGNTEPKSLSLEKSIEIAVGMEFDKMRRLIYDHQIIMNKELLKLQESAKKQQETTEALHALIESLIHENTVLMRELIK